MLQLLVLYVAVDTFLLLSIYLRRPPPLSTLFPYTTLFRSRQPRLVLHRRRHAGRRRRHVRALSRQAGRRDRKSTRLNSSHPSISYAVFCLKKKMARSIFSRVAVLLASTCSYLYKLRVSLFV